MRSRLVIVAFAATLFASVPAHADHQEAVRLFDDGRRLRDAKDFDGAERAFKRSIREEPSIGAYYNLGLLNEQLDRPRDAADAYRAARALAIKKNDARATDATEALGKLLDARNYVTLTVPDDVAALSGFHVFVDGDEVPRAHFNGEVFNKKLTSHEVVAGAANRKDFRLKVANRQPVTITMEPPTGTEPPPPPPPPHDETTTGGWGWQKWTGVGIGAAGLVTVGVGVVLLLKHNSDQNTLDDSFPAECKASPPPAFCEQRKNDLNAQISANKDDAKTTLPIVFGIGGALLIAGVALFVTAGPAHAESPVAKGLRVMPEIGLRQNGVSLVGTF